MLLQAGAKTGTCIRNLGKGEVQQENLYSTASHIILLLLGLQSEEQTSYGSIHRRLQLSVGTKTNI